MVPRGKNEACPFLVDSLCSIHDCKPTVCALFPPGRVAVNAELPEGGLEDSNFEIELEVKYMFNDLGCGSRKRANTVRDWLARFGIPEHDEFFLLWSKLLTMLHGMISKLEEHHVSSETLNLFWNAILSRYIWSMTLPKNSFLSSNRQRKNYLRCAETLWRLQSCFLITGQHKWGGGENSVHLSRHLVLQGFQSLISPIFLYIIR